MKLSRREFMRATGLAGLLAAFGIELPEIKAAEALPIITEAVMSPDCGMETSVQAPRLPLVDLTSLRNVSIEISRPTDYVYSWDSFSPSPIQHGPMRWEASVLIQTHELDAIGLSLDELMGTEYRYRFAVPSEDRCFEGDGILTEFRHEGGNPMWDDILTMRFEGFYPSWICP